MIDIKFDIKFNYKINYSIFYINFILFIITIVGQLFENFIYSFNTNNSLLNII